MIKAGDLVRFRDPRTGPLLEPRVYLVLEVEPPLNRDRPAHLRLTGPTIAGAPIETLLYPIYRFQVV
jgi:hypothetical protein